MLIRLLLWEEVSGELLAQFIRCIWSIGGASFGTLSLNVLVEALRRRLGHDGTHIFLFVLLDG